MTISPPLFKKEYSRLRLPEADYTEPRNTVDSLKVKSLITKARNREGTKKARFSIKPLFFRAFVL
jgi:hypothetical protein